MDRATNKEWETFEDCFMKLLKIPHAEVNAKLEAEKRAKKRKI
jgi:hypothetical protein